MSSQTLSEKPAIRRRTSTRPGWFARNETWILGLVGFIPLLALWQIGGILIEDNTFISTPLDVIAAAKDQIASGQLLADTLASLRELVPGFALGAIIGVPLGLVMGRSRLVEYIVDPYIWFFYSAPIIAFYPLLIMWFGLGAKTVTVLTFIFAFFPILANTITGVHEVDRVLVRAARSFGAGKLQILTLVIFPASIPSIAAGLRLGIGRALIGTVVGEFFGANAGLGYRISLYGTEMRISEMFVPVVAVMIIGVALLHLLRWLESSVETWRG